MSAPRAAVDSGTNSTRLLVVDADGTEVTRRTRITRLGAGVDATGRLDEAAVARTVATIRDYRQAWRAAGVDPAHVRIVATSAVRDATNRDAYFHAVREATGVGAEVVSGDEEARLSFAGAAGQVDVDGPLLVVDIGGGSTELVTGSTDGRVTAAHSMQVGSVRLTERHLLHDPPTDDEVAAARRTVEAALDTSVDDLGGRGVADAVSVVGVAGTAATLGAVHAGVADPDAPALHGSWVPAADLAAWSRRLLGMSTAERAALPGVPEGRADVIAAGALVLDHVVARAGAAGLTVSLADNLDGLVASMAGR